MFEKRMSRVVQVGLGLALGAAVAMALAGVGHRLEWWHYRTGLTMLGVALAVAGVSVPLLLRGLYLVRSRGAVRGAPMALVGLIIAAVAVGTPLYWYGKVRSVPLIHDISTDLAHPPGFVALLAARRAASNSPNHGGPELAARQRAAYPDIKPMRLVAPAPEAFDRALAVAREMGWEIALADRRTGRIEATDATFWFGFRDDVVVRVHPVRDGSRVDVRSVSRVGKSDVGTNAARIRCYLKALRDRAG